MIISVFNRVENIVGKGENAGRQHFLFFPQCFEKASFLKRQKVSLCGNGLTLYHRINMWTSPNSKHVRQQLNNL